MCPMQDYSNGLSRAAPSTVLRSVSCLDASLCSFLSTVSSCSPSWSFTLSFVSIQTPPSHHPEACTSPCSCSHVCRWHYWEKLSDSFECSNALCAVLPGHAGLHWKRLFPTTVFPDNSGSFPAAGQAETSTSFLTKKRSQEVMREPCLGGTVPQRTPAPNPTSCREELSFFKVMSEEGWAEEEFHFFKQLGFGLFPNEFW